MNYQLAGIAGIVSLPTVLLTSSLTTGRCPTCDVSAGIVVPAARMTTARALQSATLLQNGKVLLAGGLERNGSYFASAELYDPTAQTFRPTGSMGAERTGARRCPAAERERAGSGRVQQPGPAPERGAL